MMNNELTHHGILGQRWGVRRYQNPDGSLTPAGYRHLQKQDTKWAKKNNDKIMKTAKKQSRQEIRNYEKELLRLPGSVNKNGKISAQTINAYNRKMAELMSKNVSDLRSPSGRCVSFVAKRGEVGVFMALSDYGYESTSQYKNGIYNNGRIAYRKNVVNKLDI